MQCCGASQKGDEITGLISGECVCSLELQSRRSLRESEGVMSELHHVSITISGSISASGITWPLFFLFLFCTGVESVCDR